MNVDEISVWKMVFAVLQTPLVSAICKINKFLRL